MRKVNMAAVNGGSSSAIASAALSRRRQRNGSYRDSPDEGAIEVAENSRLRDRSGKRERDRDRSGRNIRRRRGERVSHEMDDDEDESSDETLEDDDDEELHGRSPTTSSYHHQQQQHHQMVSHDNHRHPSPTQTQRKSFPQPTTNWKADEMLGVAVPRKARSVAMKRSDGSWISGGGEQINRQSSASPSRQISPPSSSTGPGRKKLRPVIGGKLRLQNTGKTPAASLVQDELEVAEVLFGLTRQFESASKAEGEKVDDEIRNESKTGAVAPCVVGNSCSVGVTAIAPKRKRPRKVEDESPLWSAPISSAANAKMDQEKQLKTESASSPKLEKNEAQNTQNVSGSFHLSSQLNTEVKLPELMEKAVDFKSPALKSEQLETKEADVSNCEEIAEKSLSMKDKSSEVKFVIDLMAPPPEKLSVEDENDLCSQEPDRMCMDAAPLLKIEMKKKDKEQLDEPLAERKIESIEESDSKCKNGKEIIGKLQIDLERSDKDNIDGNKIHVQNQTKTVDLESKQEKAVQNSSPSTPLIVSGWQGNFPPFGYNGQLPPVKVVLPPDASVGSSSILHPSSILSPQPRPKRCATHCYIAQKINYHQQLARVNPIWSAAAAAAAAAETIPLYGAKQLAPKGLPPADAVVLGKSMQGSVLARSMDSSKDNHDSSRATVASQPMKEISPAGNAIIEGIEKKQFLVPQLQLSVSSSNMLPGPAFLFPVNQQQAVAASMAATVTGASKSTAPNSNSATASGPTSSMNISFAGLPPNEAQYLAIVQNGGYPFPIPANVAAASQQYRGLTPAGTIPFFSSTFYSSQVLNPSQIQQQQQQSMSSHPIPPHHIFQNANSSIGSSSSAKHSQLSLQAPGDAAAGTSHVAAENEKVSSSNPVHSNPYGQKYSLPMSQNLTLISPANPSAIGTAAGTQSDKQSWNQHQLQPQQKQTGRIELPSSKVFTLPFTSYNGMAAMPPGLDFSSMAQSGVLLQNLPEPFRQQYSHMTIPAGSATAYVSQKKTQTHTADEGASISKEGRSGNGKSEEDSKKAPSTAGKVLGSGSQTLTFSKSDEPVISSILNNNAADNSSLTLNLKANHPTTATAISTGDATSTIPTQQLIQLQKLQQNQFSMQNQYPSSRSKISSSHSSLPMYSERLPPNLPGTKFPQPLAGFPQAVAQGSNSGSSSVQSPQWKAKARDATVSPGTTSSQSAVKNNVLQQQGRAVQQPMSSQSHQNLVSFGANMMKVPPGPQQHPMHSNSQPSATIINPSQHNGSKGSLVSAQASSNAKPGQSASVLLNPQKSSTAKISSSNSIHKTSSLLGNQEPASVTSQSSAVTTNSSGTKLQQQLPQQVPLQSQKQSQHSQSQIYFANGYMQQPHSAPPNIAARFYQTRPSEQSQQQNSILGSSTVVSESSAVASTKSSNGLPSPGLMHAAQLAVAARPSSLVAASFPYMSAQTVSTKPTTEKKPAV